MFASPAAGDDAGGSEDEYATVALAMKSLQAKSGVRVSQQSGWTVIEEPSTLSLWSFTPESHPANPAVVHRKIIQEGDDLFVRMHVLCEASKPACDTLTSDFQKLNPQMTENLRRKTPR